MMYYTLITSLPRHERNFKVSVTPVSRIQLEKRLKFLPEDERRILYDLESLMWTSWYSPEMPFSETQILAKKLLAYDNPFVNDIVNWYCDIRSLFAALRLRRNAQSPPANKQDYWLGRLSLRLINNWNDPEFGLRFVYPWLPEVNRQIAGDEVSALEEILISQLWKHLGVLEGGHYFDFEAVLIYVLRWDIVNYWAQFSEKEAVVRMNELAERALAGVIT